MKPPSRIKLFRAYISYKSSKETKRYTLENCVSVRGYLAQYHNGRLRPIFANKERKEFEELLILLRENNFTLTKRNYQIFIPHMVRIGNFSRIDCYDLDSPFAPNPMWLKLSEAKHL